MDEQRRIWDSQKSLLLIRVTIRGSKRSAGARHLLDIPTSSRSAWALGWLFRLCMHLMYFLKGINGVLVLHTKSDECSCVKIEKRAWEQISNPAYFLTTKHLACCLMKPVHFSDTLFQKATRIVALERCGREVQMLFSNSKGCVWMLTLWGKN